MPELGLREYPRQVFQRNTLKVVVAQVRFPAIYALEESAGVSAFQEAIRDRYPIAVARDAQLAVTLSPRGASSPGGGLGPWRFQDEGGVWTVAVAPDYVGIETAEYERFELFEARVRDLLGATQRSIGPIRVDRVGLRYINEIRHPGAETLADWRRFLEPEVLGLAGGELLQDAVTQSLQQIQVELDNGKIAIRHGYVRDDNGSSFYLLDIDTFDDSPSDFEIDDVVRKLSQFKGWVWRVFRASITDELVDYLEPRNLES